MYTTAADVEEELDDLVANPDGLESMVVVLDAAYGRLHDPVLAQRARRLRDKLGKP